MGNLREVVDNKKPLRGMNTDVAPLNQIPHSYRFALNLMVESREGDYTSLTNEEGNTRCFNLLPTEKIIGTVLITNNQTVIFIAEEDASLSKIAIIDEDCNVTYRIISSCLNFNKSYPIQATFRINNGCDRVIYFTDNYNPIRSINLDNLGQYTEKVGLTQEDWIADANANDTWKCKLFAHTPGYKIPCLELDSINPEGGVLHVGSYFFALRYLDGDFNPTNFTGIYNRINISETALGNAADHVLGPQPQVLAHPLNNGGGDVSIPDNIDNGQSITITFTGLDEDYARFELAVIELTQGSGEVTNVYTIPSYLITGPTKTITFTGAEEKINLLLEDITVPKIVFNKVATLDQTDNRFILGNTSDPVKDWTSFQTEASKIRVTWTTKTIAKMYPNTPDNTYVEDSSTGYYSYNHMGYQRDEVYAFGIVYVFNDGTESPVFHIPGRAADFDTATLIANGNPNLHTRNQVPGGGLWDKQILTVVAQGAIVTPQTEVEEYNVNHIPRSEFITTPSPTDLIGATIERWKVYNTGTTDSLDRTAGSGELSYYEGVEVYPNITDCNGNSIWGTDFWGNTLVGTPIRHHRMPDITLATIDNDGRLFSTNNDAKIYPLGLEFTNINVPADFTNDIQGYYIVRVERDDSTSQVLDTGYISPAFDTGTPNEYSMYIMEESIVSAGQTYDIMNLLTPRQHFRKDLQPKGYLKFDEIITGNYLTAVGPLGWLSDEKDTATLVSTDNQFRNLQSFLYIEKGAVQKGWPGFPGQLLNGESHADAMAVTTYDAVVPLAISLNDANHYRVTVKQWVKPYENLPRLKYVKTNSCIEEYSGVLTSATIFGGDVFVCEMTVRTHSSSGPPALIDSNYYFSSIVNSELRHTGGEEGETHWRHFSRDPHYFLTLDGDGDFGASEDFYAYEYVNENQDMSIENNFVQYFPLTEDYDYCSECSNEFPFRLWYSDRNYQETIEDNFKIFRANNYRDLLADGGEITTLFVYKDQLYVQTKDTTWFVPTRPQEIQTNEGSISIGTGDILSIPPVRLETVDRGYGGNQDKFSLTITEFGTSWVDREAGKIFNFNKGLSEISAGGMRNWFSENIPFNDGIESQVSDFNQFNTTHKNGIGFITTFDPRHNRLIVTKKYYKFIDQDWIDNITTTEGYVETINYGFNTSTGEFYSYPLGGPNVIQDFHSTYNSIIEDLSWTATFSFPQKAWISFHSYRPNWLWHNKNKWYSFANLTYDQVTPRGVWEHGSRNYCEFYDSIKPSCLHFVSNDRPVNTKVFNSIEFINRAIVNNDGDEYLVDTDSLDEALIHTATQTSGLCEVTVKSSYDITDPFISTDYTLSTIEVQDNEDSWNLNKFYDLTSNYNLPIFTRDWNNLLYRQKRFEDGFIYYPNNSRYDFNKHSFDINPMRGKWVGCFFTYDNTTQNKYVIDFLTTSQNISFK